MSREDYARRPSRESVSKRIGKKKANGIRARDGHRCVYCTSTERLSFDHLRPRSAGGTDEPTNLVLACYGCNSIRKAKPLHVWAAYASEVLGLNFSTASIRAQARKVLR